MKKFDIVIIGAGSVGVPLSYYLAKKGKKVAVIEKNVSAGRGENRAAIGGVRATHSDPAKIKICQMSIEIMKNLEVEHGFDVDWLSGGYLYPVYDENKEQALKNLLKIQKSYDLNIDWIEPNKVAELVPGINTTNLKGATFSPEDGSCSPLKVNGAFYRMAVEAGVEFFFNEEVKKINMENKIITEVKTDNETYIADIVINAAGGFAKEIGKMVGLDLPVDPDSHEAAISEPVERFFEPMVVDIRSDADSDNYYFYQNKEGQIVFCITPNPKLYGTDHDNTSSFLPLVVKRMLNLYPRLRNLRVRRIWRGLYPMTPDGFPIVGKTREIDNLFLAVGMCGQGFMLGPGLGKIISEIIVDGAKDYDFILNQLTLYREFAGNEVLK
ncbi:MAG: FAD-binding oxidoreductase [Candidatus Delongbacteria bacterium]|nr:FAD-binding oxidoreductase [Candidatus Delongbacteria bacterium]MBN2836654.1 FAD-binding oxidoreductase [Candidatus Delongbacteria bacterium]